MSISSHSSFLLIIMSRCCNRMVKQRNMRNGFPAPKSWGGGNLCERSMELFFSAAEWGAVGLPTDVDIILPALERRLLLSVEDGDESVGSGGRGEEQEEAEEVDVETVDGGRGSGGTSEEGGAGGGEQGSDGGSGPSAEAGDSLGVTICEDDDDADDIDNRC